MLRKTHITLGIASALIVAHPATVSGVIAAVAGGGIGGWIVDIDCKDINADREKVYDSVIVGLFTAALVILDYFIGSGMCQYVFDNWGIRIWCSLAGLIILSVVGYRSKHRSFTHSLLGLLLFGVVMYFLCYPIVVPFAIGYLSHIVADIFNKRGEQLFFPAKKRICFSICDSDGKANKILLWVSFGLDVVLIALFFSLALIASSGGSSFASRLSTLKLCGLNYLQLYLIFINLITFCGFQRSWKHAYKEELAEADKEVRIQLEFETWLLNFLTFIGGGIGMFASLAIHLAYPAGYNGNWWAFCYSSILFWFTVYCYICNPFERTMATISLLSLKHILVLVYILGINAVSALLFYAFRKKHLKEYSLIHTLLLLTGALGGTIGGFISTIVIHRDNSFNYAVIGFPIMLISQITFIIYMMSIGIL